MIALVFAVSSCAAPIAEPDVVPTNALTPSASSAPPVTPDLEPTAAEIVFRADSIDVLGDDGAQLATASLVTERGELVNVIAEALGEDPVESTVPVMNEQRAGMAYDWDGLSVYLADGEWPDFTADITQVRMTVASINDVILRTDAGVSVGTAVEQIDPEVSLGTFDGLSYFLTETIVVGTGADLGYSSDPEFMLEWSVGVVADDAVVTRITVPSTNYGV